MFVLISPWAGDKHSVENSVPYHFQLDQLSVLQHDDAWVNLKYYAGNGDRKICLEECWYVSEISVAFVILAQG